MNTKFQLANAELFAKGSAAIVGQAGHPHFENWVSEVRERPVLRITASGDNKSRRSEAEFEAEQALMVLRFVTAWTSTDGVIPKRENKAGRVSIWERDRRHLVFRNPATEVLSPSRIFADSFTVSDEYIDVVQRHWGVDHLNYHFKPENRDNPVSRRVIRALTLYDSGTAACTDWEALYRYIVAVEITVSTKRNEDLEKLLRKLRLLIKYGGHLGRLLPTDDSIPDPATTCYGRRVELLTRPFETYYKYRNDILHGNDKRYIAISPDDLEKARSLAHNTVRLMAEIAHKFNWHSVDNVVQYFETAENIDKIRGLTDYSRFDFARKVEALKTEFCRHQDTFPTETVQGINSLKRLMASLSNDTPDEIKVNSIFQKLAQLGHRFSSEADILSRVAEIDTVVQSRKSSEDNKCDEPSSHSNTN